jgi:hypothetical protein
MLTNEEIPLAESGTRKKTLERKPDAPDLAESAPLYFCGESQHRCTEIVRGTHRRTAFRARVARLHVSQPALTKPTKP